MKRILITLLLAVCAVVTAAAQNRIDKLTSEFSSSGGSYTSVVAVSYTHLTLPTTPYV